MYLFQGVTEGQVLGIFSALLYMDLPQGYFQVKNGDNENQKKSLAVWFST